MQGTRVLGNILKLSGYLEHSSPPQNKYQRFFTALTCMILIEISILYTNMRVYRDSTEDLLEDMDNFVMECEFGFIANVFEAH